MNLLAVFFTVSGAGAAAAGAYLFSDEMCTQVSGRQEEVFFFWCACLLYFGFFVGRPKAYLFSGEIYFHVRRGRRAGVRACIDVFGVVLCSALSIPPIKTQTQTHTLPHARGQSLMSRCACRPRPRSTKKPPPSAASPKAGRSPGCALGG